MITISHRHLSASRAARSVKSKTIMTICISKQNKKVCKHAVCRLKMEKVLRFDRKTLKEGTALSGGAFHFREV